MSLLDFYGDSVVSVVVLDERVIRVEDADGDPADQFAYCIKR